MAASEFCKSMSALIKSILRLLINNNNNNNSNNKLKFIPRSWRVSVFDTETS